MLKVLYNSRALPLLVEAFVDATKQVPGEGGKMEKTRKADLHFLASVFANLSAVSAILLGVFVGLWLMRASIDT